MNSSLIGPLIVARTKELCILARIAEAQAILTTYVVEKAVDGDPRKGIS